MCDFQKCSFVCYSSYFLPGTASISNMARAALTLSIRTVSFPCSSSWIKRSPNPLRAANSSCVSPAALRFSLINAAILFHGASPPQYESAFILHPNGYKVKLLSTILYPIRCKYMHKESSTPYRYKQASSGTLCRKEAHFRLIFQIAFKRSVIVAKRYRRPFLRRGGSRQERNRGRFRPSVLHKRCRNRGTAPCLRRSSARSAFLPAR